MIDEPEAEIVRQVFDLYLKHRCVTQTWRISDEMGLRSRVPKQADGMPLEGPRFSRSRVHWMLTNCVYVGEVRHNENQYAGRHAPIIAQEKWNAVQRLLGEKLAGSGRGVGKSRSSSPFVGRLT